jgi:molybdate transport system substrate-binding protein
LTSFIIRTHGLWRMACLALAGGLAHASTSATELHVAVAANFAAPMQSISQAFEQQSGHRLRLSVGSTGAFYAQIRNGAPFHVLLSADSDTPARLEQEGLAVAGTRFTYATGRLVLWSRTPHLVDDQGQVLKRGGWERLAIANPKTAPYGAAALQVLERLGLSQTLASQLVTGENIAQAFQFASTGNATLGFVALSQVMLDGSLARGSAWVVPQTLHAPLTQDAVVLAIAKANRPEREAALALLRFLQSNSVRALLRAHGYTT